jgi:hypothetical protein
MMPGNMVTGTLAELRAIRAHWATLPPAAAALRELGLADQAAAVDRIANAIAAARFAIDLPCTTCRTPTPVDVVIGDPHNAEPGAVICGTCSAEIDDRVTSHAASQGNAEPEL